MGIANLVGIIIQFISGFWRKFLSKSLILGFQFFFTSSTITFALGFYFFIVTSLVMIYNKVNEFFDYFSKASDNSVVDCLIYSLHCAGLDVVFTTFFNEMYIIFIGFLLVKLYTFTRFVLKLISDEMFKLGVLLGFS